MMPADDPEILAQGCFRLIGCAVILIFVAGLVIGFAAGWFAK